MEFGAYNMATLANTYTKERLWKEKICPCCNGKLKVIKKRALLATTGQVMLECKQCGSNF